MERRVPTPGPNGHDVRGKCGATAATVGGMDEGVMRARVAEAPVGRLATVDRSGRPHLVPCCFVLVGDTIYSAVDGKPKSTPALRRLDNLRAHPHAALLVDHYADDWSTLWWVRVDGDGRVLDPGVEQDEALALLLAKYDQYRSVPLPGPVLAIAITRWRAWP
jgi:PPOX class probable F420-dependent enzyme